MDDNNASGLYYSLLVLSIILFIGSVNILGHIKIVAPFILIISLYLFVGSIIKLCKKSEKFKHSKISSIDLLFWLP